MPQIRITRILKIAGFIFSVSLFTSCIFGLKSKDPEYTFHYYAEYHKDYGDRTAAGWIIDSEDETNAELDDDEAIDVNGSWGQELSYYPYRRTSEFDSLIPELEFIYWNSDNEPFSNLITLYEIDSIALPNIPPYLDHNNIYQIEWIGAPVQEGEKVEIEINNWPDPSYFLSTEEVGDTKLTITSTILSGFLYEDVTITISRTKTRSLNNPKTKGEFTISYTGKEDSAFCN